jgi:MarR family transcriptional regulator, organic hydroperoxide resistance regulator
MIKNPKLSFPSESYELSRLLLVTRDAIRKVRNQELIQYNVHSRRVSLLLAIDVLKDRATPVAIGQYLLRERHSISEFLSRAEKDGLVEKKWDMERKNGVRVVLTSKGREISKRSGERRSIHAVMSALTPREAERLRSYLVTLRDYTLRKLNLKSTVPELQTGDRDYELFGLLISTTEAILKARQRELSEYAIEPARSGVLITIASLGNQATPIAIGKHLLRTRHSISELLGRAEKDGLVEKKWDMERKNGVRVVLTRRGKEVAQKTMRGLVLPEIMSSLSRSEHGDLKSLLQRLFAQAVKSAEPQASGFAPQ